MNLVAKSLLTNITFQMWQAICQTRTAFSTYMKLTVTVC